MNMSQKELGFTFQSAVRFCEKNPEAFEVVVFLEPSKCGSFSNARPQATPSGRAGALIRRKRSNYSDLRGPHPKWWFSEGNPLISGKSRLVKYYNLTRYHAIYHEVLNHKSIP